MMEYAEKMLSLYHELSEKFGDSDELELDPDENKKYALIVDCLVEGKYLTKKQYTPEIRLTKTPTYDFFEEQFKAKPCNTAPQWQTINIGTMNNQNGNMVLGNVVNSTLSIDNSVQNIKNQIEEKGGEDKEELREMLEEVQEYIGNLQTSTSIPKSKRLMERITSHASKHGWFYGAVLNLLGTALIGVASG